MADWSNRMANDGSRWYSDLTILPGETLADEIAAQGMSFDLAVCLQFRYPEDFDREKYDRWVGYSGITGYRGVTPQETHQTPPRATAGEVTGEVAAVVRLLRAMAGDRQHLHEALGLKHEDHFRSAYPQPALRAGLLEMTIPDKPRSRRQRYRLTPAGRRYLRWRRRRSS